MSATDKVNIEVHQSRKRREYPDHTGNTSKRREKLGNSRDVNDNGLGWVKKAHQSPLEPETTQTWTSRRLKTATIPAWDAPEVRRGKIHAKLWRFRGAAKSTDCNAAT